MIKKSGQSLIVLSIFLMPSISFANDVSLNKLFEISANNFCYQPKNGNYQDISTFFNISDTSKLSFMGQPVSLRINQTLLEVEETEQHIKQQLYQYDNKKFSLKELGKTPLNNIYTVEFSADIEVPLTSVKTLTTLSRNFYGIKFNSDSYGGSFSFSENAKLDYNSAKNIKELNDMINKSGSSSMAFSIVPNGSNSIIHYKCQVVALTNLSPQAFSQAISIK